jgi:hypothetical protein
LQSWRYQGFRPSAVDGSATTSSTRARISVIFSSSESLNACRSVSTLNSPVSAAIRMARSRTRTAMSVQPSFTRSSSAKPPVWSVAKLTIQRCCHPGSKSSNIAGSSGWFPRTSIEDGVRWKTRSSPASRARYGMACTAVAPVPMMPTRLWANPVIGSPS